MSGWGGKSFAYPPLAQAYRDHESAGDEPLHDALRGAKDSTAVRTTSLPAIVKHPPRSDRTIFGPGAMHSQHEVSQLFPDKLRFNEAGDMTAVNAKLQEIKSRHVAAWEAYSTLRTRSDEHLEGAVGSMLADFQTRMAACDAQMEADYDLLLDDKELMKLELPQVEGVWEDVLRGVSDRAAMITALGRNLEIAEEERCTLMATALQAMLLRMNEVGHISGGEVERLMEAESLKLNHNILANRKAYADLLRRLRVKEVQTERSRREVWEQRMLDWRKLHTQHAIDVLNATIATPEFSDPPTRTAAFGELRQKQTTAFQEFMRQLHLIQQLLPPRMTVPRAAAWSKAVADHLDVWRATWQEAAAAMDGEEDALDARAWAMHEELKDHCLSYGGFSSEELDLMLEEHCGSTLRARRAAAQQQLSGARQFLAGQEADWRRVSSNLVSFITAAAALHDANKLDVSNLVKTLKLMVARAKERYLEDDARREEELSAAVAGVRQAHSERHLDESVAVALSALDEIEEGYRSNNRRMVGIAQAHPRNVDRQAAKYHCELARAFHLAPQREDPVAAEAAVAAAAAKTAAAAAAKAERKAAREAAAAAAVEEAKGKKGKAKAPAPVEDSEEEEEADEGAEEPEALPPMPIGVLSVPYGSGTVDFDVLEDVYDMIFGSPRSSEAPPAAKARSPTPGAEEEAAGGDGAAAADEPAPSGESLELITAEPTLSSPCSRRGRPLCASFPLPEASLRAALTTVEVQLLREMQDFAALTRDSATEWAANRQIEYTEALDSSLRSHRPRGGRIEEEERMKRSVELIGQKRTVDLFFRSQAKAVQTQLDAFEVEKARIKGTLEKDLVALEKYAQLMYTCVTCVSLDIRSREAQACSTRLAHRIRSLWDGVLERTQSATTEIQDRNREFCDATLVGFEQGGAHSTVNIEEHKSRLASIDAHMDTTRSKQQEIAEGLREDYQERAAATLAKVLDGVPPHKTDVAFLEELEALIQDASSQASKAFTFSEEFAERIDLEIRTLKALCGHPGGCSYQVPGSGYKAARNIVKSLDLLRQLLLARSKSLDYLASDKMAKPDIDIALTATDEQQFEEVDNGPRTPAQYAALGIRPVSHFTDIDVATNMEARIRSVIAEATEKATLATDAFYAAKDPEVESTRPEKIPTSVEARKEMTDGILSGLLTKLDTHLDAAVKALRAQVVTAYNAFEYVGAAAVQALTTHELLQADASLRHDQKEFLSQRQGFTTDRQRHKNALHPSMAHPNLRQELADLQDREAARVAAAVAGLQAAAQSSMQIVARVGPAARVNLDRLCCVMAAVLDHMVMPADLTPQPAGDDSLQAIEGKSIKQLQQEAMTVAKAPGIQTNGTPVEGRPYAKNQWQLPAGALALQDLGWEESDAAAFASSADSDAGKARDGLQVRAGDTSAQEPSTVSCVDTPRHRQLILSHRRAVEGLQQHLAGSVGDVKSLLYQARDDDERWGTQIWPDLVRNIDAAP